MEKKKIYRKQKQILSKGSTTNKVKNGVHASDFEQNLSGKCRNLHELMKNLLSTLDAITIDKDSELFMYDRNRDVPIQVRPQDVSEFLRMSSLNISVLQIHTM